MGIVTSYLKFLAQSTNQHGVHSPFVYQLVTQCFYDRKKYDEYAILNQYRHKLYSNSHSIEVTDFGAGSRVFNSNLRKVSAIAKNAGTTAFRAKLLFRLARYFNPSEILEIGTSVGLATSALHLGVPNANIKTLEGCPNTLKTALNNFQNIGLATERIEFCSGEFSHSLNQIPSHKKYDMIFFDGNHSKEATLAYFEKLLTTTHNDSVWIFDDIHWNDQMLQAWEIIKAHPKVRVTIDTFWWGIVFFRREQEKEHFTIRTRKFYI